jgi:class 3 adenylate cyclase
MTLKEIVGEVESIFGNKWQTRDGRKVPEADEVQFGNDAVKITGTVLYADMVDSTGLVANFQSWFAAEIYKAYLYGTSRIIRKNDGTITAFDGDRVMAVFFGEYKNTKAAKTALNINAFVKELNSAIKRTYPTTAFVFRQSVGIDTSDLFVARTGIRNSNDLVWVGRAANYAAKLCELGDVTFPSYITEDVYSKAHDEAKFSSKQPRQSMWEKRMWTQKGIVVYRSNWTWGF